MNSAVDPGKVKVFSSYADSWWLVVPSTARLSPESMPLAMMASLMRLVAKASASGAGRVPL